MCNWDVIGTYSNQSYSLSLKSVMGRLQSHSSGMSRRNVQHCEIIDPRGLYRLYFAIWRIIISDAKSSDRGTPLESGGQRKKAEGLTANEVRKCFFNSERTAR